MDSTTLVDLASHFDNKLTRLHAAIDLVRSKHDPACQKLLLTVEKELGNLHGILNMMKCELQKGKDSVASVQNLKTTYDGLLKHLQFTSDHIPAHLPNRPLPGQQSVQQCQSVVTEANSSTSQTKPDVKKPRELVYCPTIEYLTVDEFSSVPKYMKGRITYSQMNGVVDDLNKVYKAKYKILRMKRSTLNDSTRKKYEAFKLQETKDTKGLYFVVEQDMKEFGHIKMDSTSRSMLTVLRHCSRLREIRGGGITRFVILESY